MESGKAPGKIWVRLCTQTEVIGEYEANDLQDLMPDAMHKRATLALQDRNEVVLSYSYSGTTGECLQTVTTLKDISAENGILSLSSVGFVPIGEPQRVESPSPIAPTSARNHQNDFQNQWTTIDDQRFLVRTVNGGYPSLHERFIARTISQFLQRNAIEATLIQIVSTYSPTIPQLPPSTVAHIALTRPDAQTSIIKLLNLDRALQFLYDDQVECQFHVYCGDALAQSHCSKHEYLHECFATKTPALILGLTAARLREYFQNRMA